MSLRALGRQFNAHIIQPIKRVNDFLKEDEHRKMHEAPVETEYLRFEEPKKP